MFKVKGRVGHDDTLFHFSNFFEDKFKKVELLSSWVSMSSKVLFMRLGFNLIQQTLIK